MCSESLTYSWWFISLYAMFDFSLVLYSLNFCGLIGTISTAENFVVCTCKGKDVEIIIDWKQESFSIFIRNELWLDIFHQTQVNNLYFTDLGLSRLIHTTISAWRHFWNPESFSNQAGVWLWYQFKPWSLYLCLFFFYTLWKRNLHKL